MSHSFQGDLARLRKTEDRPRFLLRKKGKRPTIFLVDMEIMRTLTSSVGKIYGPACCLLLCTASGVLGSDVVLQRVPVIAAQAPVDPAQAHLVQQATFALINYNLRDARTTSRALYVSS